MSFADYVQRQERDRLCRLHNTSIHALREALIKNIDGNDQLPYKLADCQLFADEICRLQWSQPCATVFAFPHDDLDTVVEFANRSVHSAPFQRYVSTAGTATCALETIRTLMALEQGRRMVRQAVGLIYIACDDYPDMYVLAAERIRILPPERNCVLRIQFHRVSAEEARSEQSAAAEQGVQKQQQQQQQQQQQEPDPSWWAPVSQWWVSLTDRLQRRGNGTDEWVDDGSDNDSNCRALIVAPSPASSGGRCVIM